MSRCASSTHPAASGPGDPHGEVASQLHPDRFPRDQFLIDRFLRDQFPRDQFPRDQFPRDQFPRDQFPREQFLREQGPGGTSRPASPAHRRRQARQGWPQRERQPLRRTDPARAGARRTGRGGGRGGGPVRGRSAHGRSACVGGALPHCAWVRAARHARAGADGEGDVEGGSQGQAHRPGRTGLARRIGAGSRALSPEELAPSRFPCRRGVCVGTVL